MTFTPEDAERFARDALRLADRIQRAVDLIDAGGPVEAVQAILAGWAGPWDDDNAPPVGQVGGGTADASQGRWRVQKYSPASRFWTITCPAKTHTNNCGCDWGARLFPTHTEAVAYVDAQIRARALTALEGQP